MRSNRKHTTKELEKYINLYINGGIIKEEMYRLTNYETFEKLENDLKQYIEFYNTRRVSLKMGVSIRS